MTKAKLRAEIMSLYPTMNSIQEVIDMAESKLPINNKNELFAILMIFQNTLLNLKD